MGLQDRLNQPGPSGSNGHLPRAETLVVDPPAAPASEPAPPVAAAAPPAPTKDPYADLKSQIHRACIAKLGTELLVTDGNEDLTERVQEAVAAELALDRTPLSREEREQIAREIADDILGYGPLEPFLRDDSVTEVMVNGAAHIYVERNGKIERTTVVLPRRQARPAHRRPHRVGRSAGGSTRAPRSWTPACPTAAASTRSSRRCR